ncbi:related to DUS3 - member of dihydrouridine synthase family [Ustilago trichophora]|uniref:tRNA-dihydrouridine(47) synthase [NAD(P)(+)] n=1 Tax=Ustilago trichophora TaxID=86804 RepID=A0A5C3EQT6_9BASI|nr:related to DUS3 - member of dihydrouridine synthase family [Ustilago trichophora]
MADVIETPAVTAETASPASGVAESVWKHPVYGPTDKYTPGIAPIKPEYILPKPTSSVSTPLKTVDDDAAERSSNPATTAQSDPSTNSSATTTDGEPPKKLKGAARKRARREEAAALAAAQRAEKKSKAASDSNNDPKKGGQNKGRQFNSLKDGKGHCHGFLSKGEEGCKFASSGGCRFSHDVVAYLNNKDRDLYMPAVPHKELEAMSAEQKQVWLEERYSLTLLPSREGAEEGETFVKAIPSSSSSLEDSETKTIDPAHTSLDFTTTCPIFAIKGFCTMGWKCRFLGSHVRIVGPSSLADATNPTGFAGTGLELVRDEDKVKAWRGRPRAFTLQGEGQDADQEELNFGTSAGMKSMRIRKYPLPKTKAVLKYLEKESKELAQADPQGFTGGKRPIPREVVDAAVAAAAEHPAATASVAADGKVEKEDDLEEMENSLRNSSSTRAAEAAITNGSGIDVARIRPTEKRRLNWKNQLYLAPLTTTGNLPFRRICSSFGSDIHCGEMGLAESFLHGNASEWSLVRRHSSERIFGTQLCGGKPDLLVPVAEALKREIGDGLDFVDINCGCPIDLVYNKGAGSALLDHPSKLSKIVRGMNAVLGDTPLTIKLRTGTGAKQTTHKLFAKLQTEWGASAATLHGRSRKQRYKNDADWSYISHCADTLRSSVREWNEESRHADEAEMVPIPIFGNGDVFSWQDYYERMERTTVDGEMIARGALIKPWLFTEIKERRDWDISSRERLDMMRNFAEYGLSHWGSDTHGVNTTRRFMCEMMSFTHRYVPTGLLEFLPSRLNDRPPLFRGRDELETLLASGKSEDWVKVSEMFLGKAPEEWSFTPKHKSSSYADVDAGEQQG